MDWKSEIQSWKMGGMLKVSQCPHLKEGRMGGPGERRALHIWVVAKQRASLCPPKVFVAVTSMTFFFL